MRSSGGGLGDVDRALRKIIAGLAEGSVVPPGALAGVVDPQSGRADSGSLILAIYEERPMAPKLMYAFSHAAMKELKRGRSAPTRQLDAIYCGLEHVGAAQLAGRAGPMWWTATATPAPGTFTLVARAIAGKLAGDLDAGYSYLREQEAKLLKKWLEVPYSA